MSSIIRKVISTTKAPAAIGAYSQAVLVDRTIYVSGQVGLDPSSGQLVPGGIVEEAKQALTNLGEILKAAGCDFSNGEQLDLSSVFVAGFGDACVICSAQDPSQGLVHVSGKDDGFAG
ncbi:2-iminobutanoate/2-iminopropanoate deaminase isoform X3 [Cricetulus griseus]|uniref:2-iminobutanoate/2-iminopropanoate deaminase isoform X3 n=1 Tax=Cricetulus griseus TaxID=10029 RepID=A0A9J7H908_CRIGR|nr:2-iminobutanoate/2-iminopropanoate deaminase isoform X3 [Cricetulus griseus]